jgi:hypothetical protein
MANDLERRLAQAERALREALERQAASDEVLRVIASSPGELGPVFQAMLENAIRVCDAKFGTLFHCDGELLQLVAEVGTPRHSGNFSDSAGGHSRNQGASTIECSGRGK